MSFLLQANIKITSKEHQGTTGPRRTKRLTGQETIIKATEKKEKGKNEYRSRR